MPEDNISLLNFMLTIPKC